MVVRDLAAEMVGNVSLGDTVSGGSTEPCHEASTVTEELTVQSGKGTTGEVELGSTVVGEQGVSVLQEGDENEPVVDPDVRKLC